MYYYPPFQQFNSFRSEIQLDSTGYYSLLPHQFYNPTFIIPINSLLPSINQSQIPSQNSGLFWKLKQSITASASCEKRGFGLLEKISSEEYNPTNGVSTNFQSNTQYQHPIKHQQDQVDEEELMVDHISQPNYNLNENLGPYPKKNTESNIVNQIFSFVSSEGKSKHIMKKYFKEDNKKIKSFYQILKAIKKRKKKYINRKYISNLCTIKEKDIGYKMLLRACNKMSVLSVPQFQKALSTLVMYYLCKESEVNIITSKKISKITHMEHLERRKEIKIYLIGKFMEVGASSEDEDQSN